jgi:hypothetical protein
MSKSGLPRRCVKNSTRREEPVPVLLTFYPADWSPAAIRIVDEDKIGRMVNDVRDEAP